jgi:hypothetical protein
MVGRRDDDGVDVGALEDLPEVLVAGGARAGRRGRGLQPLVAELAHRDDLDVRLGLEVEQVRVPISPWPMKPTRTRSFAPQHAAERSSAHEARPRDSLEHGTTGSAWRSPPREAGILVHPSPGRQASALYSRAEEARA